MALTYTNCIALLKSRATKKLANNTYLRRKDEKTFAIRLHNTDIICIYANNTYTINTGGWNTVTTKARIHEYSPVSIYQKKWRWYLDGDIPYVDGCRFSKSGKLLRK